ncbi:hypothetical protein EOD40_08200 [Flavobacterium sufflavum]|uniref:Uncharacterized protein n=1 Tax=Flavobacterium sufflavum TaxID=1921138 RepID=A0A437KVT4_9FLAO|nr:hypothetical protein EOD40_08200 [Flavobacterium sufflavum]
MQFIHRTLTYVIVAIMLFLYFKSKKFNLNHNQRTGIQALVFLVFVQFALGVFTLLYGVPLWLGEGNHFSEHDLILNNNKPIHQSQS